GDISIVVKQGTFLMVDNNRWPVVTGGRGRYLEALNYYFLFLHVSRPMDEAATPPAPLVGIIMGSKSDWETMKPATEVLVEFDVPHECRVVSAHRTPQWMCEYAETAEKRGLQVIIAGAGGAAHLPGMVASQTILPVLGVPVKSRSLQGLDSLLSIVQMPGGVPVGTLAIGQAGAKNAALLAIRILAGSRPELRDRLAAFHTAQRDAVMEDREL
ncbi:MAG: 5-(carboxyamino)imidazole ribonucleotide mutase, partial [Pirellulales bacterium]